MVHGGGGEATARGFRTAQLDKLNKKIKKWRRAKQRQPPIRAVITSPANQGGQY